MSAICTEGISTNPEIMAVTDRVFNIVRLSMERATEKIVNVSGTTIPDKGIEKNTFDFLTNYQKINRNAVLNFAGLSRTGNRRLDFMSLRMGNGFPKFNFGSSETILKQALDESKLDQLKLSPRSLKFSPKNLDIKFDENANKLVAPLDKHQFMNQILDTLDFKRVSDNTQSTSSAQPQDARELHLVLSRLKAIRRYGPELTDWGNDSISCGGDGVDSTFNHVTAPSFFIHTFKRDHEDFNIRPDKTLLKFDLNRPGEWPRSFISNVFIAERDASGGFVEFLQKLWDAIGKDVISIATTLTLSAVGVAVGTGAAVGSAAPVVGTIVGAIIGAVIGLIVSWLIDSLKDDIFESSDNPIGCHLATQQSLFPGNSPKSPELNQDFSFGNARYIMRYYWQLVF